MEELPKTDEEWRAILSEEQFRVCRLKGTERAFTGEYYDSKEPGRYVCVCCGAELFTSDEKFDSGTGWPSFFSGRAENLETEVDRSHGMVRTEVHCKRCKAHLGHLFDDGPPPTGKRFCVNSVALRREAK